ncbi:MAG TPA: S8 family serine peptidase [Candidatus Limnocylindria bacterium]|nr:S8 family serine peptidase [Candidatus Limnocylindria bacterium]
MLARFSTFALALSLILSLAITSPTPAHAATIDPELEAALARGGEVHAIAMFDHPLTVADKARLLAAGATLAIPYTRWPWAGVVGEPAAIRAIAAFPDVTEMQWAPPIDFYLHESVPLIRADDVWAPKSAGGLGITGAGVGVAVVDSGIYGAHPDLQRRVVKNLKFVADYTIETNDSDTTSGHGTHVAGTIAGDGTASKTGTADDLGGYGWYTGVAPGANLIGLGVGDGRNIIWALSAFNWIADNHRTYNIRVVSNSWGPAGGGAYDPTNSISRAAEDLADLGITVVFAAGNDGSNSGTTSSATNNLNSYCGGRVICVAAGQKDRQLSTFSSVGPTDNSRTPTLTAPGTRICAARNPHGITTGTTADAGLFADTPAVRPEWKAYYTCISGTSMATPHVSGVVALMMQANPALTPVDVATVLRTTATPMPGYQPYQVGAGYLDAYGATALAKKTRSTGTCTTKSGKQLRTIITSETYASSIGPGVADIGAASHDLHPFQVASKAIRVTVTINWTTPQDLDLAVLYPDGSTATTSGNFPGVTTETATKRDGDCSGSLPSGEWQADAVGYLTVTEPYEGTIEVEYLAK